MTTINMPANAPADNPVLRLLDRIGLPWRCTLGELMARYGLQQGNGSLGAAVAIDTAQPLATNLFRPLSCDIDSDSDADFPATQFSGYVHHASNARKNLRMVTRELEVHLGVAAIDDCSNALIRRWQFGATSVQLGAWPPVLQHPDAENVLHKQDPRFTTACHIYIETGFKLSLSAQELDWLRNLRLVARVKREEYERMTPEQIRMTPCPQYQLRVVRQPTDELDNLPDCIGCSAGGERLIFMAQQLYLIPVERILGFHVTRLLRARGPGGSRLSVQYRAGNGNNFCTISIISASGADDLNDLASLVSNVTGKPFTLGDYDYNV